jgi:putative nucleotidyltransferase with HDIG domain
MSEARLMTNTASNFIATNFIASNLEFVLPFLPAEPGLLAHVKRVAVLAGRSVRATGGTSAEGEIAEIAGLLHHHDPENENDGSAKLLADLGFSVPASLRPLPPRAKEVWQMMVDARNSHNPLLEFVESANLFDEQIENLPYEDLSTGSVVQDLMRSGMLNTKFVDAVNSFRGVSRGQLLDTLKSLPVDIPTRRWFPAKSYDLVFTHSMEVAEAASLSARQSNGVNEADAYVAGVFHDIGRVAFQSGSTKRHLEGWEKLGFPTSYAEFLISGTDHAAIGAELLHTWDFPTQIVEAVEYHHRIELASSRLAAIIYLKEDENESLPSCARDHIAATLMTAQENRYGHAAG